MILVSSHRPLKDCSPEILRNQLRARATWEHNADRIVYFGPHETALDGDKVTFVPCENFPTIVQLAMFCSEQRGWSAIVNADIVLKGLPRIQQDLSSKMAVAAVSRRWQFQGENFKEGVVADNGMDFFAALPSVWKMAAQTMPIQYHIGHCLWDTWMVGFLATHYFDWFWDLTPCRAVFHPKHEDRRTIFHIDQKQGQAQLSRVRWPDNRLCLR